MHKRMQHGQVCDFQQKLNGRSLLERTLANSDMLGEIQQVMTTHWRTSGRGLSHLSTPLATVSLALHPSDRIQPTDSAYSTCPATCGNGVQTSIAVMRTRSSLIDFRKNHQLTSMDLTSHGNHETKFRQPPSLSYEADRFFAMRATAKHIDSLAALQNLPTLERITWDSAAPNSSRLDVDLYLLDLPCVFVRGRIGFINTGS